MVDISAINSELMNSLNNEEVVVENVIRNVVDNTNVIKKIEDKRRFVTAENQARQSYGLSSNKVIDNKSTGSTQTTSSYNNSYNSNYNSSNYNRYGNSGYNYGSNYNSYYNQQRPETIEEKARKFSDRVIQNARKASKNRKTIKKSNWNLFDMQEEKEINELKGKRSKIKISDKKKILGCKIGIVGLKILLESAYTIGFKIFEEEK